MSDLKVSVTVEDTLDLDQLTIDEVLDTLHTSRKGLTEDTASRRLDRFGPNALPSKKENKFLKFLSFMNNPLSWVMEAAAIVAIALANGDGQPPDYPDFIGIIFLLLVNATIGYYEESKAGDAVKALMAALAPEAKVLRDGQWKVIEAIKLVPGDIIALKLGDIIPADCKLLQGDPVKIDQAALTGESLPVTKETGDEIYSGSTMKQGEIEAVVIATGVNTFFGKAAHLVDSTESSGHFQEVLSKIGSFCLIVIAIFVVLELCIMYPVHHYSYRRGINNILVLLIGGIPIAMPTVLSVTLAIGAHDLAAEKAIVTRMTAIEELAAMDILCSDKTGTLTLNKLTIDDEALAVLKTGVTVQQVKLKAAYASRIENQDAIDYCIINALDNPENARKGIKELHFMPFDPVGKRTQITYKDETTGKTWRVSKGAPQIMIDLCPNAAEIRPTVTKIINNLAERGLRALGVCECLVPDGTTSEMIPDTQWEYIGVLPIFDPPRHDTAETIENAIKQGVSVKMVTGDQLAIGKETARRLGMGTVMYETDMLLKDPEEIERTTGKSLGEIIEEADGFAGVFPEHKYAIVKTLKDRKHTVGMTGDGVNDAPALKVANIGIAVDDATDAARAAADIVLTEPGLSVIISAIIGSRRIFQRMKNYSIYACSTTVRIVVQFALMVFIWKFDMPPFMILIIAFLNDGTIMTISTDRVKPSPVPDSWNLFEIFTNGIGYGVYLTISTIIFYFTIVDTSFWEDKFHLMAPWKAPLLPGNENSDWVLHSIIYLQTSISGQALIFSTRSYSFWFMERPGIFLMIAFCIAQFIATFLSVYATWGFTEIRGIGWGWAAAVWVWCIIWFIPIDLVKFAIRGLLKSVLHKGQKVKGPVTNPIYPNQTKVMPTGAAGAASRASVTSTEEAHRASLQEISRTLQNM